MSMSKIRPMYNKRRKLLDLVFDEKHNVILPGYDKFGRLLYQIYDINKDPVYDHKGKPFQAIYDSRGRPKSIAYDRQGKEVIPKFDLNNKPIMFLYDKDGIPLYDMYGNPWENVAAPEVIREDRRKRRKHRVTKHEAEIQQLTKQIEEIKNQLNEMTSSTDKQVESKQPASLISTGTHLEDMLQDKLSSILQSTETKETESIQELKRDLAADIQQGLTKEYGLSESKTGLEEKISKHVRFDLDNALKSTDSNIVEEVVEEESISSEEENCDDADPLGTPNEILDGLECFVTKIFNATQSKDKKDPLDSNIAMAFVMIVRALNNFYCTSRQLLKENEEIGLELNDQYDQLEHLEVKKTMSRETQEQKFKEMETRLNCLSDMQVQLQCSKLDHLTALEMIKFHKQKAEDTTNETKEYVKQMSEDLEKTKESFDDMESEVKTMSSDVKAMAEDVQNKEDKADFEAFSECVFSSLKRIENYINKYMTKPVMVSGGRTPEFLECKCISCGQDGIMSKNAEKPLFPILHVFRPKVCKSFQKRVDSCKQKLICLRHVDKKNVCCDKINLP
ncbi:hypothetical protein M8J76_007164 [Diaphorina citri]|nr:hypothetical protein M8J75_002497 [Diaphorina citri]KAI5713888.1 hypothetical protein M8J76_007164 [Diaphorina citri]